MLYVMGALTLLIAFGGIIAFIYMAISFCKSLFKRDGASRLRP